MSESLEDLNEKASGGQGRKDLWFTNENTPWILGPEADEEPNKFHVVARMPSLRRHDTDARQQWWHDRKFIVALVNAYRSGQLHDDATLSQARADALAQGRREGLEEAVEACRRVPGGLACATAIWNARDALATAPTETQKPEETA